MKSLQHWTRTIRARTSPFTKSLFLSMFLHVYFLFIFGVILVLFEAPNLHRPRLIFDLVFAPAEGRRVNGRKPSKISAKPQHKLVAKKNIEIAEAETPYTRPKSAAPQFEGSERPEYDQPAELDPIQPNYVPNIDNPLLNEDRFVINKVVPASLALPRLKSAVANCIPAKIAVSTKQRKMLFKRFRKWTENLDRMDLADSSLVWKHKGKIYVARFRRLPGKSETDIDEVLVEVHTEEAGYTLSTEMRMKRLAFSNFAQFVDYWDPRVAVHDDVLEGRFHSNSKINVSSSFGIKPEFHGKVTTASYDIRTSGTPFFNQKSVFLGGLETGVKEIRLPKKFLPFLSDSTIPSEQSHILSEDAHITFYADGSYTWHPVNEPEKSELRKLPDVSFYIIGAKKKKLHLKGVLKGKVLVYSPSKIIIDDDLTYARHPEISTDAEDYLGLVCDKDIEIAPPSITGPGDLHIYAAIYAKGRFRVQHLGGKRGATLHIYGSLTAGSLSATEPRYATRIRFDKRLEKNRPPNFPMTDRYEITHWEGEWEVK